MLIEREKNLHQLNQRVLDAQGGQGNIALITGEAGIGKTTVIDAFKEAVQSKFGSKVQIAAGGSAPLLTPRALGPLRDMSLNFNSQLQYLINESSDINKIFDKLLEYLASQKQKTIILIFEDAHWADDATFALLKFLSRRITYYNVLIVITYRANEVNDAHPLTDVLKSFPMGKTTQIELQPISKNGIEKLLVDSKSSLRGQDIYEVTHGNPFFITELLGAKNSSKTSKPASLSAAVSARINLLHKEEQNFLETISLIPQVVRLALLQKLFGLQAEAYAMACVKQGLLTVVGTDAFRFRHELSRLGTLERLSTFEQKNLHAKILDSLLQLEQVGQYDHIVHHASGALDAKRVLEYAPRAAKIAGMAGSHREAASHLSTALRFIDSASTEQAAELYESWALETGLTIGVHNDVIEARRHAISLWRALGNNVKVGKNLYLLARLVRDSGQATESARYLDEAINVLEEAPLTSERAMAYSMRSQQYMLNDHIEETIEWGLKALELEEQSPNLEVRIHALNNIGSAKIYRGVEAGYEDLKTSLNLAINNNFHVDAARAYSNYSEGCIKNRKLSLADDITAQGIAYMTKHDLDSWIYYYLGRLAELRLLQGRFGEAEKIAKGVLGFEHLTLLMKLPAQMVLARIYSLVQDDRALEQLELALGHARATNEIQHVIWVRLALLEYAWLNNDIEYALDQLQSLYLIEENRIDPWTVGEIHNWGVRLGYEENYPYSITLPIAYQLELNGQRMEAADKWESLGMPYHAALVLAGTNDPAAASQLERALTLAAKTGVTALFDKVKQHSESMGLDFKLSTDDITPYNAIQKHPLGFTQQEKRLFKLMIDNVSVSQMATQLRITQAKVAQLETSILTKMNVTRRIDATIRAQNEPWLL